MAKNIVICCDGTGNEFGAANSNVVLLYSVLDLNDPRRQVAYYHPGVGTMGSPHALLRITRWVTRKLGMAFGYGLSANIADAYTFLMNEYEPGDRLFVFGFSRGAYTARALCGMIYKFGLISRGNEGLVAYAARMFRYAPKDETIAAKFKQTFSRSCPTYFLGLWDTVSSIGWITDPVHLPYTRTNPELNIARHAVSIDERRCFYRQNLLAPWRHAQPPQDIQQVWFAGVHSDVGGSYEEPPAGLRLPRITLRWMLDEAVAGELLVDKDRVQAVLGNEQAPLQLDPKFEPHNSLKGVWWLLEFLPHRYEMQVLGPDGKPELDAGGKPRWVTRWRWTPGKPRTIAEGACIHASVGQLRQQNPGYQPRNLPAKFTVVPGPPPASPTSGATPAAPSPQ
jgi:uncharacterized protein (DUF2235 family)